LGAFLARHPFKIVAADRRRGRRFPRTAVAEAFLMLYAVIALVSALGATATAVSYAFLMPLAVAVPLACIQLSFDFVGRSRGLVPELAGALGLAAISSSIALAAGWPLPISLALWAVVAARSIPAMLYVHTRIQELHGGTPSVAPALIAHTLALIGIILLAILNVTPLLAVFAMNVLLVRAVHGFSKPPHAATAKQIGLREVAFGAFTVLAVAVGYIMGW
jgi:hypothetical protein